MNKKIEEIKQENITIFIYFILLITYLYANSIEINYFKYQKEQDKQKYRNILYIIFGVSFLITLYYTIAGIKELKEPDNNEILKLKELSSLANILILISTALYLYIIYKDENINLEISP